MHFCSLLLETRKLMWSISCGPQAQAFELTFAGNQFQTPGKECLTAASATVGAKVSYVDLSNFIQSPPRFRKSVVAIGQDTLVALKTNTLRHFQSSRCNALTRIRVCADWALASPRRSSTRGPMWGTACRLSRATPRYAWQYITTGCAPIAYLPVEMPLHVWHDKASRIEVVCLCGARIGLRSEPDNLVMNEIAFCDSQCLRRAHPQLCLNAKSSGPLLLQQCGPSGTKGQDWFIQGFREF
jgi:hypothetical protein